MITYSFPAFAQGTNSNNAKPEVVSALGKVPGKDLYVDIIVVVPPGSDRNDVVNEALRLQGARTLDSSDYSLTGLKWPTSGNLGYPVVAQYYNQANQPTGAESAFTHAQDTWTNEKFSNFEFQFADYTNNCPSLVRECQGPQKTDGENDVAWLPLSGKNTLGVTWYDTSAIEADMALNTKFQWHTDGSNYDIQTVFLHELGHVLGLGHSDVTPSVMYPYYSGEARSLYQDDECGIQELYGTPQDYCSSTNNPPPSSSTGSATHASVDYDGKGGKLQVNVNLYDSNNNGVPNTSVTIRLNDGTSGQYVTGELTKSTDSSGKATWNFVGASGGSYCTEIIKINGSTLDSTFPIEDPCYTK